MYDPPAYLWAITIAGPVAVVALTCIVLYGGAAAPAWVDGAQCCSPGPRPPSSAAG